MMLLGLLMSLSGASDDSVAILRARECLQRGDTLQAIEELQDWSANHVVGRKLTDLLGALHMPDEPIDSGADSLDADVSSPVKGPGRKWSLRSDEMISRTDRTSWYLSAGAATGIAAFGSGGNRAALELGVAGCVWNGIGDTAKLAFAPLLVASGTRGKWDGRLDAWGGILGGRLEAGAMAVVARGWTDSVGASLRVGGSARVGRVSSDHVDIFCQAELRKGAMALSGRSALRLRRDPVGGDSTSVDSLRTKVVGARIQSASRIQALFGRGAWSAGPALDLDLRRSLSSDSWFDGEKRRKELRQEGVVAAQGVVKFVSSQGVWIQSRLGGTIGFGGTVIDPGFEDRNSGLAASVSVGAGI